MRTLTTSTITAAVALAALAVPASSASSHPLEAWQAGGQIAGAALERGELVPHLPHEVGGQVAGAEIQRVGEMVTATNVANYLTAMETQRIADMIAAERAQEEADRAEAARMAAVAQTARQPAASASSGGVGACTGFAVPDYIIQRESGGNPNAYNASSGAIGCTQTLISHYNAGGICSGLDPYSVDGQRVCTQRLVDADGLAPWSTG